MPTTPTIPAGNLFMNATTYTGTGASLNVINGVAGQSFQPDFVWIKSRSVAENHLAYDSVRGTNQRLYPNLTAAESTATNQFNSFNSNGFTLGADPSQQANITGATMVAWNWKAGGTAVSNTDGTRTSSVSANQTSGFSVATFTAQSSGTGSVGHGLGATPSMLILKTRNAVNGWPTYHSSVGLNNYLLLNSNANTAADSNSFTAVSSTTFTLGSSFANGNTYVAYCWAPIAGYSAFGSYTGNGSTDGPFVYTGFRPKFVLFKSTSVSANDWIMYDTSRNTYNVMGASLVPNSSAAENGVSLSYENIVDFLSNGFKLRQANYANNGPSVPYIYMAFAENPFKYANAR